jgi:hypothetical protein
MIAIARRALIVSFAVTGFLGCATPDDEDSGMATGQIVAGTEKIADHVKVFADRLEFDSTGARMLKEQGLLEKVKAYAAADDDDKEGVEPVIFLGGRNSTALNSAGRVDLASPNPLGYLRRALSYSTGANGGLIVKTAPSNLDEARSELAKNGFLELKPEAIRPLTAEPSDDGATTDIDRDFTFDAINTSATLVDWKNANGESAKVVAKPKLTIKPHLKASIAAGQSVKSGSLYISGEIDGSVELDIDVSGALTVEKTGKLLDKPLLMGATIGPVPVSVSVDLGWKCGLDLSAHAKLSTGITATGTMSPTGADWNGAAVNTTSGDPSYTFTPIGPTFDFAAKADVNCHIIPNIAVSVFDVAGPVAIVDLWAKVEVKDAHPDVEADLYAGGSVTLGGGLQPFGYSIATWLAKPINFGPTAPLVTKTFSSSSALPSDSSSTDSSTASPSDTSTASPSNSSTDSSSTDPLQP